MMTRRLKRPIILGAALVAVFFARPFLAADLIRFSHTTHTGLGIPCDKCHAEQQGKGQTPRLNVRFCGYCHDGPAGTWWKLPVKARKLNQIAFEHYPHSRDSKCVACHQNTAADRQPRNRPLMEPETCLSCHAEKTNKKPIAEPSCARCHGVAQNRVAPKSHRENWAVRHGRAAEWDGRLGHGQRCELCHGNGSCVTCHRTEKPRNHTGLWRARMHGTAARWNRDSCTTCHETGTCVSCHRRTPPQSHRGAWKATHGLGSVGERCATCHEQSFCIDCHRGRR